MHLARYRFQLTDTNDPLVTSTMTLVPIIAPSKVGRQLPRGSWTALGLSHFVAIPLLQPQNRARTSASSPMPKLEHLPGRHTKSIPKFSAMRLGAQVLAHGGCRPGRRV